MNKTMEEEMDRLLNTPDKELILQTIKSLQSFMEEIEKEEQDDRTTETSGE